MNRKRKSRRLGTGFSDHITRRNRIRHVNRKSTLASIVRTIFNSPFFKDKKTVQKNQKWYLKPFVFLYKHKGTVVSTVLILLLAGVFLSDSLFRTVSIDLFMISDKFRTDIADEKIFANKLENEISLIVQQAKSLKPANSFKAPLSYNLPDVPVPSVKISSKTILTYINELLPISSIRSFFGYKTVRISGNVILISDNLIQVNLTVKKGTDKAGNEILFKSQHPPAEIDLLMREAGEFIVENTEPYLWTSYLYQTKGNGAALAQIPNCLNQDSDQDAFFALVLWGLILDDEGKYEEASKKFQKALEHEKPGEKNRETVVAYNLWGQTLYHQGKLNEAIEKFQTALERAPDYAPTYSTYALALWKNGEKEKAIEKLEQSLRLDPKLTEGYYNLGLILSEDDVNRARSLYLRAIELDPKFVPAYSDLGLLLSQKMSPPNREEALIYLNQAIERDKNFANAYNNRGLVSLDLDKIQEAMEDFKKAVDLYALEKDKNKNNDNFRNSYADANNNLGWTYELSGKYVEAEKYYRIAVEIKPDYFIGYIGLGDVFRKLKRFDDALTNYDYIIQNSKVDERENAFTGKAKVFLERSSGKATGEAAKDIKLAEEMLVEAKKINPDSEAIKKVREEYRKKLKVSGD